jgi:(1->4)-alpha-D-glucan 1-alpha-D-glucosylmutase
MHRIPVATYRLQLHSEFGFDDASAIADYLHELGISHVYCSPYLQAAPGSKHGYDVVDQHKVNEELGGNEAHDRFSKRLGEFGLGQVLDMVPNHMAISGRRNRYWWDVLENGPSSRYASYFDIDWAPQEQRLRNKLLVPILGDHYGRALTRGEIRIERHGGQFINTYFETELPVAPRSLPPILHEAAKRSGSEYLEFLAHSLHNLPVAASTESSEVALRHRDKTVIFGLLDRLFSDVPFMAESVDNVIAEVNRTPDRLDDFLEHQNYRLARWQTSSEDLGYRRFFDVNTLVGLRQEDPKVFADTHALILRWLREGVLDGLRIDHPDGLRDPRAYFERLRAEAPEVWIIAEKILESGEKLPSEWPVDGTTGYDFLNLAGGLFVDQDNEQAMTQCYSEFTGAPTDYLAICRDKKHRVLRDLLGSDVNRLAKLFGEICECNRDRRDYTREDIIKAIRELVANFPVYRTYVVPERDEITETDTRYVEEAVATAKQNRPDVDSDLFDFFRDVLLLKARGKLESEFVMQFQQFSGPAMAKGVEDTVFYSFDRLVSLNEVGGDPGVFGTSIEKFHAICAETHRSHPYTMLTSSTHDTKRSGDVRARINVLTEIPQEWRDAVVQWSAINEKHKQKTCPDPKTEYFIYQTLIGSWPIGSDRLWPYLEKASREAKEQTSWLAPNEEFEKATRDFAEAILHDEEFLSSFVPFVEELILPGRINSLAQTLLKFTAPGVPDTYQGTELWDLSLVDPDNRRPVDYELRRRLLTALPHLKVDDVWNEIDEGVPKLWTITHAIRLRRERPAAFGPEGEYIPVCARGAKRKHVVAFTRGNQVMVIVPRLPLQLDGSWDSTSISIPPGQWLNVLDGDEVSSGEIELSSLLNRFPIALLAKR